MPRVLLQQLPRLLQHLLKPSCRLQIPSGRLQQLRPQGSSPIPAGLSRGSRQPNCQAIVDRHVLEVAEDVADSGVMQEAVQIVKRLRRSGESDERIREALGTHFTEAGISVEALVAKLEPEWLERFESPEVIVELMRSMGIGDHLIESAISLADTGRAAPVAPAATGGAFTSWDEDENGAIVPEVWPYAVIGADVEGIAQAFVEECRRAFRGTGHDDLMASRNLARDARWARLGRQGRTNRQIALEELRETAPEVPLAPEMAIATPRPRAASADNQERCSFLI